MPSGKANRIPSILSNIPPCPGKIDPVSFILAFLLKKEITKSPNCYTKEIIIININIFNSKIKNSLKQLKNKQPIKIGNKKEPRTPE